MTNLLFRPRIRFPQSCGIPAALLALLGAALIGCDVPSSAPKASTQEIAAPAAPIPAALKSVPNAAQQVFSEAEKLRKKGKYEKALARAEEARDLARAEGNPTLELKAMSQIGSNLLSLGKSQEALQIFETALHRARQLGETEIEATVLTRCGFLLHRKDAPAAARAYEASLKIWEGLGKDEQIGINLYNLGDLRFLQGDYAGATAFFERALPFTRRAKKPGDEASVLNGMATVLIELGESEKAIQLLRRALTLAQAAEEYATEASVATGLAFLHRRRGELKDALKLHQRSLEINQEEGTPQFNPIVRTHLGGTYLDLGQPEEALKQYGKALYEYRKAEDRNGEAITLASIGRVHLERENLQTALQVFEESLKIARANKISKTEGRALHGIGMAWLALNQFNEAIRAFEQALPRRREASDLGGEAATLLKLGLAYQAKGDLEQAAIHLRSAEERARSLEILFIQAEALLGLARIDRDRGDFREALARGDESLRLLETARSNVASDWLRSSFFASRRAFYEFRVDLLVRLEEPYPGKGYAAKAFAASEMARSRSLLDLLAEGRLDLTRGIAPSLKAQEREIIARLSQIQAELQDQRAAKPDEKVIATLNRRLEATEDERRRLEQRIIAENPLYAQVRYPKTLTLPEVQKHLNSETALLEYFLGEEGSYLFVVTQESFEVHPLPGEKEIEGRIQQLRQRIKNQRASYGGYVSEAFKLYEDLVAPADSTIAGKRRLLIAADGALQLLPFEALLTTRATGQQPADLPYLLREYSVSYIPSASVLSWLGKQGADSSEGERGLRFLAFADPVYGPEGDQGSGQPPRLAGTEQEVAAIERLYPKDKVLVYRRERATEGNFRAGPGRNAERIHVASHGSFDEERPEYSGLLLTRTKDSDGVLRVYEIFELDLNADLVVLSACETGLGKRVSGEGLMGITRAFLYAGAPSVVVSLWRVSDSSVPALMPTFYRALDATGDKAEALRRAKIAMIKQKRFAHPYHWAPFILIGRPDSVSP